MKCQLFTGGGVLASTSAETLVGQPDRFKAEITAFALPATMPYGIDGDDAESRTALVTVANTGTEDWTGQWLPLLSLHAEPAQGVISLPGPVVKGTSVTIPVDLVCLRAHENTFTVRMIFSDVPISPWRAGTTNCLGANSK
jgi:hypothetical protein